MASITATRNYKLFELARFNRDVKKTRNLEASMKRHGWIDAYPMHVTRNGNNKLQIKDGHHRFEVAQRLQIAVKYVVCEDTATMHELQRSVNWWTLSDYFASFCRLEKPDYLHVRDFMERTGIQLSQAISLVGGESASSGCNFAGAFKDGTFTVSADQSHAEGVGRIIAEAALAGVECATKRDFVSAISRVLFVPEFDADVFILRMHNNPTLLTKQVGIDAYAEMIEYVYNYRAHTKTNIAFPAKQLARERSIGKAKR